MKPENNFLKTTVFKEYKHSEMTTSKKPFSYKRGKTGVEINGEPDQVKWPMWFDLITSKLLWVFLAVTLLILMPKASLLPLLWQWLKKQLPFLTLFGVVAVSLLALSG